MEFPRNMQKHCQSLYAIHNYTQSGCHQSRLLYLFSDITHTTQSVFDTSPSAHPLTTSNSASSLIQLSFGMHYHLILSLLLLWISLNHRSKPTTSKQFSTLYICKYVTFLSFLLLIDCKYMVCSCQCIVVKIDGASYDCGLYTPIVAILPLNTTGESTVDLLTLCESILEAIVVGTTSVFSHFHKNSVL